MCMNKEDVNCRWISQQEYKRVTVEEIQTTAKKCAFYGVPRRGGESRDEGSSVLHESVCETFNKLGGARRRNVTVAYSLIVYHPRG